MPTPMQSALDYGEAGAGTAQPQAPISILEKPDDLRGNKEHGPNHETGFSGIRTVWARKDMVRFATRLRSHTPSVHNGAPGSQPVFESREKLLAMLQFTAAANEFILQLFLVVFSLLFFLNGQEYSAIGVDSRYVHHALNLFIASLRDGGNTACTKRNLQADATADRLWAASEPKEDPDSGSGTAWPTRNNHGSSAYFSTGDLSGRRPRGPGRPGVPREGTRENGGNGQGAGRGDGGSGGGGGGGGGSRPGRPRVAPDDPRMIACHFSLHPDGSNDCPGFKRLCDVPIHLFRKHMQPRHCPQCKLILKNDDEEQRHIIASMARPCLYNGYVHPGITPDQRVDITNRSHRHGTPEQRWNDIWRILFPGLEPPSSPYIVSPFTCRLRKEIAIFQRDGYLQNAVGGIVPIGPWYDAQTLSAWALQCLQSFVEHVERREGSAPARASHVDSNAGMSGTPSPAMNLGPRPPAPSPSFQGPFTSVPVTFSPLVATPAVPIAPHYLPDFGIPVDSDFAFVFDDMFTLGPNNLRGGLGEEVQYEIANVIHLDPVPEEDVDEGTPDNQWP